MQKARAFAAHSPKDQLAPFELERRDVGARDVQIDILFCGVCHSDLYTARGEESALRLLFCLYCLVLMYYLISASFNLFLSTVHRLSAATTTLTCAVVATHEASCVNPASQTT